MSGSTPPAEFVSDDAAKPYQSYGVEVYVFEQGFICLKQLNRCGGEWCIHLHPLELPLIAERREAAVRRERELRQAAIPSHLASVRPPQP